MPRPTHSLALWAGVLGAPAVWGLQLQAGYAISPLLCHVGSHLLHYLLTVVCATLTVIAFLLSRREWMRAGRQSADQTDGGTVARTAFLGVLGMITSTLFTIVVIAQGLAAVFFDGCWS